MVTLICAVLFGLFVLPWVYSGLATQAKREREAFKQGFYAARLNHQHYIGN